MVVCLIFSAKIMIFANISDRFLLETVRWKRFFYFEFGVFCNIFANRVVADVLGLSENSKSYASDTFVCGLAVLNLSG